MRTCAGCDTPLPDSTGRGRPRKWCSQACRVQAHRNRPEQQARQAEAKRQQEQARQERQALRLAAKQIPCPVCETPFVPDDGEQRTCSLSCGQFLRWKDSSRKRTCEVCGEPYRATYKEQRTCSRACGFVLRRANDILRKPSPSAKTAETWPTCRVYFADCRGCGKTFASSTSRDYCAAVCYPARRSRVGTTVHITCEICAQSFTFTIRGLGRRPTTCSAPCARAKHRQQRKAGRVLRRARKRAAVTEPVDPAYIYERDRWHCQLCGRRVAKDKTVPHPYAPTLDHVVPLAKGGDHTAANLQLAHFICNSAKSDRGSQQLALIG